MLVPVAVAVVVRDTDRGPRHDIVAFMTGMRMGVRLGHDRPVDTG
jgi:hypothetical protein